MRGKLQIVQRVLRCAGITPACAGKTLRGKSESGNTGDHPRVCGENRIADELKAGAQGSPPRVRGKPSTPVSSPKPDGITPACAGKTKKRGLEVRVWRDHPRVCGENESMAYWESYEEGSPPRVRGKQGAHVKCGNRQGITPACAGKTLARPRESGFNRDHPRVCGENRLLVVKKNPGEGSPPRVRGKPNFLWHKRKSLGITPACAGKTRTRASVQPEKRDHPRVCGENQ